MSTNYSGPKRHNILADAILREFNLISEEFSSFQKNSNLDCVAGCGKCCFKPDIYCSPVELLPMALELIKNGEAEDFLKRIESVGSRCIFLKVTDEENFKGYCTHYEHRPLTCRTFGVYLRHGKNKTIEPTVCKVLKDEKPLEYQKLKEMDFSKEESKAFIDVCKNRLASLDPSLMEEEMPINQSLRVMISKMLLYLDLGLDDSNA